MDISEIGGEFALIKRITKPGGALVGIGDDAAAIDLGVDDLLLVTTDMLCEGDHFRLDWSTPRQIGRKCMEVNVSDIAAMGGVPTHAFIALSLTKDTTVEFMDEMYRGVDDAAKEHGFAVVGGDTTQGKSLVVSVTMLGRVPKEGIRLRSGAKPDQLICVTGDLGKSTAGLKLLLEGLEGDVSDHLEPRCRLKESQKIAPLCSSMIDVSDGLASEIKHICEQSGVGALIIADDIPISDNTNISAKTLGQDPYEMALSGGEDFELVFTIDKEKLPLLDVKCPVTVVGRICDAKKGVRILYGDKEEALGGGYDHFNLK